MFPMMRDDEVVALVDDIRANGLIEPIWVFQKQILDGRNRFKGCNEAGVEPVFREWKGTDPLGFVVSENLRRRHLDAGRRAAIAVRRRDGKDSVLDRCEAEAKERQRLRKKGTPKVEYLGEAAEQAAAMFLVGKQYVYDAKRVREADPALLEQVIEGDISLQDALDEIATRKQTRKRAQIARTVKEQSLPERQYPVLLAGPTRSRSRMAGARA
jgi:hypothetical protein